MNEITIIAIGMFIAFAGIAGIKALANVCTNKQATKVKKILEESQGAKIEFVSAFGHSAIAFTPERSIWTVDNETCQNHLPDDISGWFVGRIRKGQMIAGLGALANLSLGSNVGAVKSAARQPEPFYAILYNQNEDAVTTLGLVDEDAAEELAAWLESALPSKRRPNP